MRIWSKIQEIAEKIYQTIIIIITKAESLQIDQDPVQDPETKKKPIKTPIMTPEIVKK